MGQITKIPHGSLNPLTIWGQKTYIPELKGSLSNVGSVLPEVTNTSDLGSSTKYFNAQYINSINFPSNGSGVINNPLKITNTTDSSSTSTGSVTVLGGLGVAKKLYANEVYGGVWQDYAEYREVNQYTKKLLVSGNCIVECGNDLVTPSTKRLQKAPRIISDTYGMAIGKSDGVPVAVSGRVLAYTDKDKYKFKVGDPVCSGKNGTVSKMSRLECILFPDRILGVVSCIPEYTEWGPKNISVKNRIWINV